jgi:hypothetical protein
MQDRKIYLIIAGKDYCNNDEEDVINVIIEIYKERVNEENFKNTIMTELYSNFEKTEEEYRTKIIDILGYDIAGATKNKMRNLQRITKLLKKDTYVDNIIIKCQEKYNLEKQNASKSYCIIS